MFPLACSEFWLEKQSFEFSAEWREVRVNKKLVVERETVDAVFCVCANQKLNHSVYNVNFMMLNLNEGIEY